MLIHLGACFASAQKRDKSVALPVIDKQDIRFVPLSAQGEPFKKWVLSIAQDNYGFMWFGTDDGLYRFDGYTLKSYRHDANDPRSLSDNTVTAVYKDRRGRLWVGTAYGGLNRLDPSGDVFTHFQHDANDSRSLSDQNVVRIFQDHFGALWIGTNLGLDRLDETGMHFFHYRYPPESQVSSSTVIALGEDGQGNLFVGSPHGLYKLERSSGVLTHFPSGSLVSASLRKKYISGITADRSGALWLASALDPGVSTFDSKTGQLSRYAFRDAEHGSTRLAGVDVILHDHKGTLWLGTFRDGLLKFDKSRQRFIRYSTEPGGLFPANVTALFEDSEGNMWVGGHAGVSRFQTAPLPFVNYRHEPNNSNSLSNDQVLSVHAARHGILWIGTAGGLERFDQNTGQILLYQHEPRNSNSLSYNEVSAIREDGSGGLWIGTHGGGLNRFNPASGRFVAYRQNPKDPHGLSSDLIQCLWLDRKGILWIGTHDAGLNRFDPLTDQFKSYGSDLRESLGQDNIREIFEDRTGVMWVGTNGGLVRFVPDSEQFTVYVNDPHKPGSLSHNSIGSIFEDRQGTLWIGTRNGLNRYDRAHGSFKSFTTRNGLADDAIEAIQEDNRGNLWLATHQGISEFNPLTHLVHNYSVSDGLPGEYSNPTGEDRSCLTPEGEIVFGSQYGVTIFNPDKLSGNPYIPPVVLTNFLLFNRPVRPARNAPLQQPIWTTHSLTLNHKQSIFTVEFAALSYVAPERNRYRYRLEGLERQWNEVDSERRNTTYTNLAPGKYTFRVQGSNNNGIWNKNGVTLAITVLPPWWATWWFNSLAALIIAGAAVTAYRSHVNGLRLQTVRLESQVKQRTQELQIAKNAAESANQAKTAFLANISHELRTPLNAILGFSSLLREQSVSGEQRRDLDIINRSGEHLLNLINDVLDMSKIEAGRVVINDAQLDVKDLGKDVIELERLRAEEKGLDLSLEQGPEVCRFVRADGEKLREILINLVSNAVKYTQRGTVTLRVGVEPAEDSRYCRLVIEVQDTGIGIATGDQERIFEPFVQLGKSRTQRGTGLGLAITKKYIDLMGGTIRVESAPGQGSLFHAEIPVMKAEELDMPGAHAHLGRVISLEPGQTEYRILIVEDQEENWLLLQRLLENAGFASQVAEDGETAIRKFQAWRPHFIWMDWQLPGIDGLEVARRIRQVDGGREVKIVILSAFAFSEYRDNALQSGVDDFVSKPFQAEEIFDCMARHLGVRYAYQTAAKAEISGALSQESLANLPEELRNALTNAVVSLDLERINSIIARISEHNPALGRALSANAARYEFSQILQALELSQTAESL